MIEIKGKAERANNVRLAEVAARRIETAYRSMVGVGKMRGDADPFATSPEAMASIL
jgi:hypothetical protein